MNAISKLEWQAPAGQAATSIVLWQGRGWLITAAGMHERYGCTVAAESLADVREDGTLSWPVMMADAPKLAMGDFLHAFRIALKLHGHIVDPAVLRRSEKAAAAVQQKSIRSAAVAQARRARR